MKIMKNSIYWSLGPKPNIFIILYILLKNKLCYKKQR